jgi:small subunit ribosomal protein S16
MLMIRLQRIGKKKSPSYRFVVSEKARDTQGKALEILGRYNPVANPKIIELNEERIKHWLSKGAQTSESVNNLLINQGVIEGGKKKSVRITIKRQKKIDDKVAKEKEAKAVPVAPAESVEPVKPKESENEEKGKEVESVDEIPTDVEKEPKAEDPVEKVESAESKVEKKEEVKEEVKEKPKEELKSEEEKPEEKKENE